jgi:flagellar export protein FliJ
MKNLKTLIKLRKHKLNQLLLNLNEIENQKDQVEEDLVQLAARMNVESQRFYGTEYGFALDEFMESSRKKRKEYLNLLVTLEQKANVLKSKIHEEFSEMKKFELVLKNRINEAKKLEDILEIKETDDISVMRNKREYI